MFTEQNKPWWVLIASVILIFIINIDFTAVNLTLVKISEETGAGLDTVQWLLSAYVLAWGAAIIPAGKWADLHGKRRSFLVGVVIFMVASMITGMGDTMTELILGRIMQGIGGAFFIPPVYTLVFATTPPERQGFAVGFIGVGAGLGMAVGPTLGGWLVDSYSWRWIFYINVPLCLACIGIIMKAVEKEAWRLQEGKINMRDASLLSITIMAFIFGLHNLEEWGLFAPELWALFVFGVIGAFVFVRLQKKTPSPLMPLHLFKNKTYVGIIIFVLFFHYIYVGSVYFSSLYLQNTLNNTPLMAGLLFLPLTLAIGILSPFGGKLVDKMDARIPLCGGTLIAMMGALWGSYALGTEPQMWELVTYLVLMGVGLGFCLSPYNTVMMQAVPQEDISTASGVFAMFALMSCSLGVILSTELLIVVGKTKLAELIASNNITLSAETHDRLMQIIRSASHGEVKLEGVEPSRVAELMSYVDQAFVSAYSIFNISIFVAAGICLVATARMVKPINNYQPPKWGEKRATESEVEASA